MNGIKTSRSFFSRSFSLIVNSSHLSLIHSVRFTLWSATRRYQYLQEERCVYLYGVIMQTPIKVFASLLFSLHCDDPFSLFHSQWNEMKRRTQYAPINNLYDCLPGNRLNAFVYFTYCRQHYLFYSIRCFFVFFLWFLCTHTSKFSMLWKLWIWYLHFSPSPCRHSTSTSTSFSPNNVCTVILALLALFVCT